MKKNNNLKKLIAIAIAVVVVIAIILLIWFGINKFTNREQSLTCSLHSDQNVNGYVLDTKYDITYQKDIVQKVHIVETIKSDSEETLSKFEEQWNNQYSYNKKTYGGYTYEIKKETGKVYSDVTIDYTTMNLGKFIRFNAAMEEYTKDGQLTYEGIKKMYEKSGAVCS